MLLVVGHPGIGAGLEALLRIEDRYDTRRVQSVEQVRAGVDGWTADVALVDGVLVEIGRTEALAMPTIVLSGNAMDGARLASRLPAGRGWLRKDATADDLRRGIERALVRSRRGVPPRVALLVLLLLALAIIATLIVSVIARG